MKRGGVEVAAEENADTTLFCSQAGVDMQPPVGHVCRQGSIAGAVTAVLQLPDRRPTESAVRVSRPSQLSESDF